MEIYYRNTLMPLYKPFMCNAPKGPFKVITNKAVLKQITEIKNHLEVSFMVQASLHKFLILQNIRKNYSASHTIDELNVHFFDASMIWNSVLSKPATTLRRDFWVKKFNDAFDHTHTACGVLLCEGL